MMDHVIVVCRTDVLVTHKDLLRFLAVSDECEYETHRYSLEL